VVEDAGDVGGEEEFAVAEAEDGGRAHAGGDQLVGLGGGEDADGEGAGEAGDGAADGFFERGGRVPGGRGSRTAWDSLAESRGGGGSGCEPTLADDEGRRRRWGTRFGGGRLSLAASSSSSWMTWAMISVSVSEGTCGPWR
jgi:hypothetical protein